MIKETLEKLTTRLGIYNGLLFQTEVHFIRTLRKETEISQNRVSKEPRPILGSNFVYKNPLTGINEFKHHHFVTIDNLEENIDLIKLNYFNFIIAQSFETFETFLKDIIAAYLYTNPSQLCLLKETQDIPIDSFEKCRDKINSLSKDKNQYNKRLFNIIYKLNPDIKIKEKQNSLSFDFNEWNIVLTTVRHKIIHSNSILSISNTKEWSDFQKEVLNKWFIHKVEKGKLYISTVNEYQIIIKHIAQHAQLIYDKLIESEVE